MKPELRRLAEAADRPHKDWWDAEVLRGYLDDPSPSTSKSDAAYIAAMSPEQTIALLDRIAALEAALRGLLGAMEVNRRAAEEAITEHGSAAAAHESGPLPGMDAAFEVLYAAEKQARAALDADEAGA